MKERIVGKIDARHEMPGMEGDLFGLGKKVLRIPIEGQFPDTLHRHEFFRNQFGRIEEIKIEFVLILFFDDLHAKLPFRKVAIFDGFPQIAPMKVRIQTGNFLRFIPHDRMHAQDRLPVKFDKPRFSLVVDKSKGVHPEPFHHTVASWNRTIGHDPHNHVHGFRH